VTSDATVTFEVDGGPSGPTPIEESLLSFDGRAGSLLGVLARPAAPAQCRPVAVVIVVGGPQTRVGSHRQFVQLARRLAAAGYPCLRFDYTGMGDSPGPKPDFEAAGADVSGACDTLRAAAPGCRSIALWGLCDGATAAAFQAAQDERIAAVIAANPWARSDGTRSATMVRQHYGSRLRSPAFWKKLLRGRVDVRTGVREFARHLWRARRAATAGAAGGRGGTGGAGSAGGAGGAGGRNGADSAGGGGRGAIFRDRSADLPARLADALSRIAPRLHLQLSGNDLTAAEFELAMKNAGADARIRGSVFRLPRADHTFSEQAAWDAVIGDTIAVLERL